jgi:predicted alpha/beta superfamily hydrolase
MLQHPARITALLATLILAGCTGGERRASDTDQANSVPISSTVRHMLYSDAIGQAFAVDVALPFLPSSDHMPVVYVTDGGTMFPLVANAARLLQLGTELPPMLIVGIGYTGHPPAEVMALRARELTPTVDEDFVAEAAEGPFPQSTEIPPGGADTFLDFIEDEVKPFIRANYPVSDDETLVGDSLGGLFTLYALFNRTGDYDRYLAGSPSIWWDGEVLFTHEAAYAAAHDDLDVDLFLSVGALEEGQDPDTGDSRMVSNTVEMGRLLKSRGYPSLRLSEHIFEGETHVSVIPATFSRGLRALFAAEAAVLRAEMLERARAAEAEAEAHSSADS